MEAPARIVLSSRIENELYRISQEALNNVLKHARARNVSVALTQDEHGVRLTVIDDGVGFDPSTPSHGMGIAGIRERVGLLRGKLELDSEPGKGTIVHVVIPVP